MKKRFGLFILSAALCALLCGGGNNAAHAGSLAVPQGIREHLSITMPGDYDMECGRISSEIAAMEEIMIRSGLEQDQAENTGTGITVAKALGGFVVGSVPGAIGVIAAGHFAGEIAEDRRENAEMLLDIAAQRRSMMLGMFNAKRCAGPLFSPLQQAALAEAIAHAAATAPAAGIRQAETVAHPYQYND